MTGREAIYSALFNQISAAVLAAGAVTTGRRLLLWSDVPASAQPAVFMAQKTEEPYEERGRPTRWHLNVDVYIYTNVGEDPNATPATQLNNMLDAVEGAFPLDPASGFQALGGKVWEAGGLAFNICFEPVATDEGTLGSQAVAIMGIRLTAL